MKKILLAAVLASLSAVVLAKIPAPVLSDEAKAKAAETAAKAAWAGKVDGYLLCKSMDKAAASYYKTAKAAGKDARPPVATPACADPGAFSYKPPEAVKPIEAAGAHSPAATATSPPSSKTPAAAIAPEKKS